MIKYKQHCEFPTLIFSLNISHFPVVLFLFLSPMPHLRLFDAIRWPLLAGRPNNGDGEQERGAIGSPEAEMAVAVVDADC
jgi:hypothetical protein